MSARHRARAWSAAAALAACGASACSQTTEVMLVIDTNLSIPVDMDRLEISVSGAADMPTTFDLNLTDTSAPGFPRTLGLRPTGELGPLTVRVVGYLGAVTVIQQDVRTAFVEGEQRMLRVSLLTSCLSVGTTCSAEQTCLGGGCGPVDRPGTGLPAWDGRLPSKPQNELLTPIQGRTVWASSFASAAIDGDTLWAWGRNFDGQLGIGTTQNAKTRRPVMKIQNPSSIGLGQSHSCVCDSEKRALCWGSNAYGQLGTGNLTPSTVPILVPGLTDCEQIAGGGNHTCVVRTDRTVACWGQNANGQSGQPGPEPVTTPHAVPNVTDVAEVQCGDFYTCARRNDGSILCWGDNRMGQLGDGTTTARATPVAVMGVSDSVEVAVGRFAACSRNMPGQVSCWGSNASGLLGVAGISTSDVPVAITAVTNAAQVAVGQQHVCVLRRLSGVVSCWGGNQTFQLGNTTMMNSLTPVDVVDIAGVTSIASGSGHVCARHAGGLSCWGQNDVNQLGDATLTNRNRPISVVGFL